MQRGFTAPLIILGIVILVVIATGAFYAGKIVNYPTIVPVITLTPKPSPTITVSPIPSIKNINSKTDCETSGGNWSTGGFDLSGRCFIRTKDAGKACTDKSDCEGGCLAPNGSKEGDNVIGQCSKSNWVIGCNATVEKGRVTPTLCID